MKRLVILCVVVAFVVAIPLSHMLMAGKEKAGKTYICHITGVNDDGTRYVGHVIYVSDNAVKAHCQHGDHHPVSANETIGNPCSRAINNTTLLCGGVTVVPPNFVK